jgi:hypothetical protein
LEGAYGFVEPVQIEVAGNLAAEVRTRQERERVLKPVGVDNVFGVGVAMLALANEAVAKVGSDIKV